MIKKAIWRLFSNQRTHTFILARWRLGQVLHKLSQVYLRQFSATDTRYFRWLYSLELSKSLPGDIVELGVGPGRFMVYCGSWVNKNAPQKTYWGYDTFAGFPSIHEKDREGLAPHRAARVNVGVYSFYGRKRIEKLAAHFGLKNVKFIEGDLAKTVYEQRPEQISFLYIDCDLYEGYIAGLDALYDRVVPGGIILFDEYEWVEEWPGARRAVDEFFRNKPEKPQKLSFSDSWYVIKQPLLTAASAAEGRV